MGKPALEECVAVRLHVLEVILESVGGERVG